jgi:hypothetical protein
MCGRTDGGRTDGGRTDGGQGIPIKRFKNLLINNKEIRDNEERHFLIHIIHLYFMIKSANCNAVAFPSAIIYTADPLSSRIQHSDTIASNFI